MYSTLALQGLNQQLIVQAKRLLSSFNKQVIEELNSDFDIIKSHTNTRGYFIIVGF